MLDTRVKRTINNARDVLVGKVPNPQSQVDLITIAMIYKFMDDMDLQALEISGKRTYFKNNLEKYAFSKLLDPRLGAQARLNLYIEALEKLPLAKSVPELFRTIFKGAFLPFRDPQTLSLFLKEIACFSYDNSENLGNAFEYLLSIMGSQGDAGQFRTPRHIIDFIVAIVKPRKTDTILDPACGTAGFLISAYLYIRQHHKNISVKEMQALTKNISGYDISPDMRKLALVNLYLHKFTNPKIYEYDTLTQDDRWKDKFDLILANPPFMTPKGGIRPHNKFSVSAKRSEVLFVDYIAEHLTPNGRAGIIVPEGIVFQSAIAYKSLRKILVENHYLYAVISLPPGVFNPYSGVKTSILLLDRQLAKKNKNILFIKIENDGFDLGAQRREIQKNDLPTALDLIEKFKTGIKIDNPLAAIVPKEKIKENDYILTITRYNGNTLLAETKYEKVKLGDLLDYEQPQKYIVESVNYDNSYKTPVLTANQSFILGYTNETNGIFDNPLPVIIFDDFTTDKKFVDFPFKVKSSAMKILKNKDETKSDIRFLYEIIKTIKFDAQIHKRYWISEYANIEIPLPPLDVQKKIIAEVENKQKAIASAQELIRSLEQEKINAVLQRIYCSTNNNLPYQ